MSTAVGLIRIGFRADLAPLSKGIDSARGMVSGFASGLTGMTASLAGMAAGALAGAVAVQKLTSAASEGVEKFIELDSAMNLMSRTTGFEGQSMADLEAEIREMATSADLAGVTLKQLTDIGIMGGRMGVDRKAMPAFIKDIAMVGIALDDIPVEEAAQSITQILGAYDMGTEHTRSFASALNILSNNAKTTGGEILAVAGRLKGPAATLGMEPQKMLALATALKDVGITTEVAGSSMNQILAKMSKDTQSFARVAGVSLQEYQDALVRDPLEALKMFIGGLQGGIGDFALLEEVGITGSEESGVILQLARAMGNLDHFIQLSNDDWETHASLLRDNALSTAKVESQMQHLDNRLEDVSTNVGKELSPAFMAARVAWVEFVETNADGLIDSANLAASAIKGITPIISAVADISVRGFKLARAMVEGLAGGALSLIGSLAKGLEWLVNLIPGVEIDLAGGIGDLAQLAMADANRLLREVTDGPGIGSGTGSKVLNDLADGAGNAADEIDSAADAIKSLGQSSAVSIKEVTELTSKLQEQLATFHMSEAEAERYRLGQIGATAADLEQIAALQGKLEALEAEAKTREELEKSAERIIDQTRTPLEQFKTQGAELEKLLSEGLIDTETFKRAVIAAGEGLGEGLNEKINAGAMELGSQEARSAILQAQGAGPNDGLKDVAKTGRDQLGILAESQRLLRRIADNQPVAAFSF